MKFLPWLLFGFTALVLVGWVGYQFKDRMPTQNSEAPSPTEEAAATPTANLLTYSHPNPKYAFNYSSDLEFQSMADGSVVLTKWGPTQKQGTEFYDGISLNFKAGQLNGQTLKDFVDQKAAELGGVFETSSVTEATLGSFPGYQFHVKGYVEGDYYYLDLGTNSYLEVINATKDPTSAGFAATVMQVLGSLTQ